MEKSLSLIVRLHKDREGDSDIDTRQRIYLPVYTLSF